MVSRIPGVKVSDIYGTLSSAPTGDQLFAMIVECTKGTPNVPVEVYSTDDLYQQFKVYADGYFGVGNPALLVVRAAADADNGGNAPVAAAHKIYDTAATPVQVATFTAKQPGSYEIFITVSKNTTAGNNVIVEEDGVSTEYYIGIEGVENLVARINNESQIITGTFIAEGTGSLATIGTVASPVQLGTGGTNVAGSDGTTQGTAGAIPDSYSAAAHEKALAALEDYRLAGVFTTNIREGNADQIYAKYSDHVTKMNSADEHGWRFGIVGACEAAEPTTQAEGTTQMGVITSAAAGINNEGMMFVGQGVTDMNGNDYSPAEATQIVAGKMSNLDYQIAIWGGQSSKVLGLDGVKFISDVRKLPGKRVDGSATKEDIIQYNQMGVITFQKEDDGIRIREGVTTVQSPYKTAEDEVGILRIRNHANYLIYDTAFGMLGQNVTSTFKTDLQEELKSALEVMKSTDQALTDDPDNGLSAYDVSVTLMPNTVPTTQGTVKITAKITPVHAARQIEASVVIM